MNQSIVHIALVVRDYDEAIAFYTQKLHFTLLEDTYQAEQDKRWVVVAPPGFGSTNLLLARASTPEQETFIGHQSGGRVFLFLSTDDFWRDYHEMVSKDIEFVREPKQADYGMVAAFKDLYGNLWDLLEFVFRPSSRSETCVNLKLQNRLPEQRRGHLNHNPSGRIFNVQNRVDLDQIEARDLARISQ